MNMSDKILNLRKQSGLTQEELAERLEVSRQSISKWEGGQSLPDIQKIIAIAKFFSVTTDYLLYEDNSQSSDSKVLENSELALVTAEITDKYLTARKSFARLLATAVFLFITSALLFVLTETFENSGNLQSLAFIWLFVSVATGVGLILFGGYKLSPYKYIENGKFELGFNVENMVREKKDNFGARRVRNLIAGIAMYIISPLPLIIFTSDSLFNISVNFESPVLVAPLFLLVGFATAILILSETKLESYKKLLHESDRCSAEDSGSKRSNSIIEAYWLVVTAAYLLWSFLGDSWSISWVIWPVAGVLSGALSLFLNKNSKDE